MGEFKAGVWLVALSLYFALFVFVGTAIVQASNDLGLDHNLEVADPGIRDLGETYNNLNTTTTINSQGSADDAGLRETVVFMATFGDNTNLGLPDPVRWFFAFIFFYVPVFMLGYSLYMILPWIH